MPNTIKILFVMYINFRKKEMPKDYVNNCNVPKINFLPSEICWNKQNQTCIETSVFDGWFISGVQSDSAKPSSVEQCLSFNFSFFSSEVREKSWLISI